MIERLPSKQFILFVLMSGIAALVNIGSRIIYNQWLTFSTSILLAYASGMVTAFILAKLIVFKNSQQALHRSMLFFFLVNMVALLQTWIVSIALASYILPALGITQFIHEIAHAVGVAAPLFTSYVGHKKLSFR